MKKLCIPLVQHKNTNKKENIGPSSSISVETEQYEVTFQVLQAGHGMNYRSFLYTNTLQIVQEYPIIVRYFVSKEAFNRWKKADQRTAVERRYLETVYTNPYHNIDANVSKYLGYTPFSHALRAGDVAVQDALYQHYSDTVSNLDLMLALEFGSRYTTAILEKNVKVDKSCLDFCFLGNRPFAENLMELLWLKIESDINDPLSLDIIFQFNLDKGCIEKMLTIIIESENTNILYKYTATLHSLESFIIKFYNLGCSIDLLMKLINRLLEYSYILHVKDIYRLFYYCGYCRLVKHLLYLDYRHTWNDCDATLQRLIMPRFLLDVHSKTKTIEQDFSNKFNVKLLERFEFKLDLKHYCASFSNRRLIKECGFNRYEDGFPKVPKLVELARNESRTFIVEAFNVSKTCQYYKIVDQLDMPEVCKSILKFERRLYL